MVMWPAVTLIGFLVLVGFVIALGMSSTARYEAEKRGTTAPRPLGRHAAPETVTLTSIPAGAALQEAA